MSHGKTAGVESDALYEAAPDEDAAMAGTFVIAGRCDPGGMHPCAQPAAAAVIQQLYYA
jgi:hypothetical protein